MRWSVVPDLKGRDEHDEVSGAPLGRGFCLMADVVSTCESAAPERAAAMT